MNIVAPNYPAPAFAMAPRDLAIVTDLIYHHSDGPQDQDPLAIDQEHRNEGWAMVGYDFLISGNGTIYSGRPLYVVPSAAYGRNSVSIDVCLLGAYQPGTPEYNGPPPATQVQAAKDLSVYLHQRYPQIVRTIGHRDVASFFPGDPGAYSTACPGSEGEALLPEIRAFTLSKIQH